ncbi:MAG: CCA tRNA nucleotidyltransferase [Alphaproteobacteria bacterium]|nr:CCA tRNA nucleotidyltransferase [Alphaproteobacteria bacterium]MDX5370765.1 CCA tRNA nucleotidyltransferase [Alphaproteobacteria bacterium]MDX5465179.1 CCA tRNA nucleotidyltransferase [Alphaproteobacteria bacterium]
MRIAGDWLETAATREVMAALTADGGTARFVGGCVRNALLGAEVDDIDIATPLTSDAVMARAEAAGIKPVPTGIDHGTVTLVSHGRPFEITTLRRDVETHGRHATVAYTDDWAEDAARRDFTMNALYAEADGTLVDPLGGLEDALAGRVRFVGDPHARIAEDFLRILRFFRFHAWYGKGALDAEGLGACAAHAEGLGRISAERIGKETMKLMAARDPRTAVEGMAETGVLAQILPDAREVEAMARVVAIELDLAYNPGPMRRLVALTAGRTGRLKDSLRLSNRQAEHLEDIRALVPRIDPHMGEGEARAEIYRAGRVVWRDAAVAGWALAGAAADDARWQALAALSAWEPPAFPLNGRDLADLGAAQGPALGKLLKRLEADWIADGFAEDRARLLARARRMIEAEDAVRASGPRAAGS